MPKYRRLTVPRPIIVNYLTKAQVEQYVVEHAFEARNGKLPHFSNVPGILTLGGLSITVDWNEPSPIAQILDDDWKKAGLLKRITLWLFCGVGFFTGTRRVDPEEQAAIKNADSALSTLAETYRKQQVQQVENRRGAGESGMANNAIPFKIGEHEILIMKDFMRYKLTPARFQEQLLQLNPDLTGKDAVALTHFMDILKEKESPLRSFFWNNPECIRKMMSLCQNATDVKSLLNTHPGSPPAGLPVVLSDDIARRALLDRIANEITAKQTWKEGLDALKNSGYGDDDVQLMLQAETNANHLDPAIQPSTPVLDALVSGIKGYRDAVDLACRLPWHYDSHLRYFLRHQKAGLAIRNSLREALESAHPNEGQRGSEVGQGLMALLSQKAKASEAAKNLLWSDPKIAKAFFHWVTEMGSDSPMVIQVTAFHPNQNMVARLQTGKALYLGSALADYEKALESLGGNPTVEVSMRDDLEDWCNMVKAFRTNFRRELRSLAESSTGERAVLPDGTSAGGPAETAESRLKTLNQVWEQLGPDMKAAVLEDAEVLSLLAAVCRTAERPAALLDWLPHSSINAMLRSGKCRRIVLEALRDDLIGHVERGGSVSAWLETLKGLSSKPVLPTLLVGNRADPTLWRAIWERLSTLDDLHALALNYPDAYDDIVGRALAKPRIATMIAAQLEKTLPTMTAADIATLFHPNKTLCRPLATYLWTNRVTRPLLYKKLSAATEGLPDEAAVVATHPLYQKIMALAHQHVAAAQQAATPPAP